MKKISKKEIKTSKTKKETCNTKHKIFAAIALAGLFVCGLFVGLSNNVRLINKTEVGLSAEECDAIAQEIVNITKVGATTETVNALRDLNNAYSNGCAGRLIIIEKGVSDVMASENPNIMATCSRIEQLLKERLYPETAKESWKHAANAYTYSTLAEKGCAENSDMYKSLALREIEITTALQPEKDMGLGEVKTVIDVYKKLDMQKEAQVFLDKIEKLTDPAIDFILQMEKIINE